jgi:CRISPR-associated protein Csd2
LSTDAKKFAEKVSKEAKTSKPSRKQVNESSEWMSRHFYAIRMFGAVMTTGINAGQVRGPVQLTFARSVDPVIPQDLAITRVAITREEEREKKETEIGRKTLVPYGLYVGYGFYSPFYAKQSGVTESDLELFWDALVNMFDIDRSSARGMMNLRGLYVFTHDKKLGNAPAHVLFDLVRAQLKDGVASPRKFSDYMVSTDEANLPEGVELTRLVG